MKYTPAKVLSLILIGALSCGLVVLPLAAETYGQAATPPQQTDQASAALNEGRRLLRRGQSNRALVQLQKSLELYTAAKNNRGIAAANNELGDLYLRQGQYNVALDHYNKALEGFMGAQAKDVVAAAMGIGDDRFNSNLMLAKIGDVNLRLGRHSEARAAYGRMEVKKPESAASKVGRRFGGFGAIVGGVSTGNVSVAAPTSALTVALEAKKELDEYRVSIVYSSYQLGMGRLAYVNKDYESAKKNFQNALEASGSSIAGLAKLGQTRRFRAAARTSLGDVALQQGRLKDATKFYTEATKGAQEDKRLDLVWPAQRGLGRTLWLQAQQENSPKKVESTREAAIANYRDAVKTIETLRQGSLRADEARTTFLSTTKDVFDEAANSLAEMALAISEPGKPLEGKALAYASESFQITEQSRARSLLDLISESGGMLTEGVPAELLKRKQENLERQQEIAEILTGVNISNEELKKKPADLEVELEKLQTEFDQIENEIRTSSPRYSELTSGRPLSLAEVQQKVLDDSTVLLAYGVRNEASYLWAVSRSVVTLHKLPARPSLDKLAMDLRAQLIPSKLQRRIVGIDVAVDETRGLGIAATPYADGAQAYIAAASALYKVAVEPAAELIAKNRILVVADGALNYIPFEALVKSDAAGDYSTLEYLIKSNEIVYSPSASVIGAIRQQGSKPGGRSLLVVADPVFNSNDARAKSVASTAPELAATRGLGIKSALADVTGQSSESSVDAAKMQGLPLARLMGTRTEAEEIAKLAKSTGAQADLWLDFDAAEDNFEARDLRNYRVVHIATHGLLNAERPQFTGLVLSLVGNTRRDGFLRTDEVFNLRLGSPLVMLSACETGLGKERRGEGVMGLTRAFMYAGAPTVGVSLWSVADRSTADLMSDFYKRLLGGGATPPPASAAMREAQLAMITGKKYSAPFYWAPFVLIGDWRPL